MHKTVRFISDDCEIHNSQYNDPEKIEERILYWTRMVQDGVKYRIPTKNAATQLEYWSQQKVKCATTEVRKQSQNPNDLRLTEVVWIRE
jgi:hypothetical protein